jgi:hypothetical protein
MIETRGKRDHDLINRGSVPVFSKGIFTKELDFIDCPHKG